MGGTECAQILSSPCRTYTHMVNSADGLRFVVIDDHELVRDGLVRQLLEFYPQARIVHASDNVKAGVRAALEFGCDCAVIDLDLGDAAPAGEVVSAFTVHRIPVLVVSALATPGALTSALHAGAAGFVTKRSSSSDLRKAVNAVLVGSTWVAPDLAGMALRSTGQVELSAQEQRALTLYASGMTVDMVARRMTISPSTAKNYIDRVRAKYDRAGYRVRTKVELHTVARQEGLLP